MHIKLDLFKSFVKVIDQNGTSFRYLQQKFSAKSKEKLKDGIFIGPKIRKLMNDKLFKENLNPLEKEAWNQFCLMVKLFLATINHLHIYQVIIKLQKSFYRVTKMSGQECH